MRIEVLDIMQINAASYNPRVDLQPDDEEYQKLKRSILTFGFVEPLVWNQRTGNLVSGHQRLKILRNELGVTEVEVSVVDLSEEDEKTLNIALNRIEGEWDIPKLRSLIEELDSANVDISLTGFTLPEVDEMMIGFDEEFPAPIHDDGFDPDAAMNDIEEPQTKPGDLWILGRHRVLCGDSTKRQDILQLMDGQAARMIFTDPPYNVNYEGSNGKKIANDHMTSTEFQLLLKSSFSHACEVAEVGSPIYIAHSDSEGSNFRSAMNDAGWTHKQTLIWVKNTFVLGRQDYQWQHEPILYGWKPGGPHRWFGGRKKRTVVEYPEALTVSKQEGEYILTFNTGLETIVIRAPEFEVLSVGDDVETTVWRFDKPLRSVEHPTMKPIPLVAQAVMNSSQKGDIVLDMFLGSGSTLIAAEQTGRTCYGVEFDPNYCDVIVRRWELFTGKKAVKQ